MVPYTFTQTLYSSCQPADLRLPATLNPVEPDPADAFLERFSLAFAILVSKQVATPSTDTAPAHIYYGL